MNKLALLFGLDDYPTSPLKGCSSDAARMAHALSKNYDDTPNFDCRLIVSPGTDITRALLRQEVEQLFNKKVDVALLYFSGHGMITALGGYLITRDVERFDEGVSMAQILQLANQSPAREKIIVLDCCHSGAFGNLGDGTGPAHLSEGVSILSASRPDESAVEMGGAGVFTSHILGAIRGGAADVCGRVTVASLYAYVDQVLGGWEQRPVLKSHVSKLVAIRTCEPAVSMSILRKLPTYFSDARSAHDLDPSYEPDAAPSHPENEAIFSDLQKLRAARLVIPVGEEHLYFAAMNSKSCRLTELGEYYWHLTNAGKI